MAFDVSSIGKPLDVRYPLDLANQSIAYLQASRPDWTPRNGSPEVVLTEAQSLATAAVCNDANATIATVEEDILANFFQVPRRPGVAASGALTVTFDATVSTTIATGTRFALPDYGVELATTADVTVTAATSAVLPVAASVASSLINGVAAGAAVDVLDSVPNLLTVAVSTTFSGGQDPETDLEYVLRARWRCARVTNSLVVADHFSAYVLEDGRASNARTISSWDGTGTVPTTGAGTDGGHTTVVTYGRGANLDAGVRAELGAAMTLITSVDNTVHVLPATVVNVDVTVTVVAYPGYDSAEVQAAVVAAVREFLAPESWTFGATVIKEQLRDRITSIPQVDYVSDLDDLDDPNDDLALAADEVPLADTITVSVT